MTIIASLTPGTCAPLPSRALSLDALLPVSESTLELVDAPGASKEVIYFHDRMPVVSVLRLPPDIITMEKRKMRTRIWPTLPTLPHLGSSLPD